MKRRSFARLASLCMVLVLLFSAVPVMAAVPSRPGNDYVLDEAGVLDASTVRSVNARCRALYQETGAELAVVVMQSTGGTGIDAFADAVYSRWDLSNAGIVLVLSLQEDDYYAAYGQAVIPYFSATVQETLYNYLEDDFAAGNYSAGVEKVCAAFDTQLRAAVAKIRTDHGAQTVSPTTANRSRFFSKAVTVLLILLILFFLFRPRRPRFVGAYRPWRPVIFMPMGVRRPRPPFGGGMGGFGGSGGFGSGGFGGGAGRSGGSGGFGSGRSGGGGGRR